MAMVDVEYRCFVGGLAWATDEQSLHLAFSPYGEIIESKIINDWDTGRLRGFGFVTFGNEKAMIDAIEAMNGQDLVGRRIIVNEAQTRGRGGDNNCREGSYNLGVGYGDSGYGGERDCGYGDGGSRYSRSDGDRSLYSLSRDGDRSLWILDSGATDHMTFDENDFSKISQPRRTCVSNANGVLPQFLQYLVSAGL
ncbi:glycine-rich RNA-binding protein-like [Malania oleifera]|uniref:glycine-rich RNA-binding protein-like n=1 Tax=Malania oleifera TaxID=397392 RepID=UPI0025ADAD65|nr:glycine-rich RNA-binding protein-like [Malania oleifera]